MNKNSNYFTTGEFAKLFSIKKQTLFHYDNIGIFKPEIVDSNGYRYYSYTQIEAFSVLLTFKDLKVPLKDIKAHMDARSPKKLIEVLENKSLEIDRRIEALTRAKELIGEKVKITKEGINAAIGQIYTEEIPDEYMILTDCSKANEEGLVEKAVSRHYRYCQSLGILSAYIGGIIPLNSITESSYEYSKFYTTLENPDSISDKSRLYFHKGGEFLALYDDHGYSNILSMCHKIMEYAKRNHLKLDDSFYEDVILDDLSVKGYEHYLVKISARICP